MGRGLFYKKKGLSPPLKLSMFHPYLDTTYFSSIIRIKGRYVMAKNEKTSKRVGTIASKQLRSKKTSKPAKSTAGKALTQRPDKKKKRK
jgi:hypothetical protein